MLYSCIWNMKQKWDHESIQQGVVDNREYFTSDTSDF